MFLSVVTGSFSPPAVSAPQRWPKTLAVARLRAAQLHWALAATSLRWGDAAAAAAHARRAEAHAAELAALPPAGGMPNGEESKTPQ